MKLFIHQKAKIVIKEGDLTLKYDENGIIDSNVNLSIGLDVAPLWLGQAYELLIQVEKIDLKNEFVGNGTNLKKYTLLNAQIITCLTSSIDALFANIDRHIKVTESERKSWDENGTARFKRILFIFKKAFLLDNNSSKSLQLLLKSIYKLRDYVVHPPNELQYPIQHPKIEVLVHPFFAAFTQENSVILFSKTFLFLEQVSRKRKMHETIRPYMQVFHENILDLMATYNIKLELLKSVSGHVTIPTFKKK